MLIERLAGNPIIQPKMSSSIGTNINGPSLIRVPEWVSNPLGRYYLYFAHHKGTFIRLAYADDLSGHWKIYEPGVLRIEDSFCYNHIASPDVHIDESRKEIRMYFHGANLDSVTQGTKVGISPDGMNFRCFDRWLGNPYFRVFRWNKRYFALGMPGIIYRSEDGLSNFENGPTLFGPNMRHSALKLEGNILSVFYSNAGDAPERILLSTIELTNDWMNWRESQAQIILEPEKLYEGADLPLVPSVRNLAPHRVRQLRDPAIFVEEGKTYLIYSVAGESGLAIAEIKE